jgi:hypothetical protein
MRIRSLGMLVLAVLLTTLQASSEGARIVIDGNFSDWDDIPPAYVDPSGDQTTGDIDFRRLWVANDEKYIFLSFEAGDFRATRKMLVVN